jgi:hypothetical protein
MNVCAISRKKWGTRWRHWERRLYLRTIRETDRQTDMTKFIVAFRGVKASKKASCWIWGRSVAQLVEALRYKPEGRGFDSSWCRWDFSLTYSFRPHYGSGVESASNIQEYQEDFLWGKDGRCV